MHHVVTCTRVRRGGHGIEERRSVNRRNERLAAVFYHTGSVPFSRRGKGDFGCVDGAVPRLTKQ